MEKCPHVSKIRPAWDHSILNPEKWLCYVCRTTESVWACLSCSNVACGRFNEKHALQHYQESKHPISVEVNDKYIYCYVCDDYVMNDNAAGDIKLLRSALMAIATQKFTDMESRGRRLLRSYSYAGVVQRNNTDESDKLATADWHQRQRLLMRMLSAWRKFVQYEKARRLHTPKKQIEKSLSSTLVWKKRTIFPGVTGLRNLGNTCYMNSILQILSHIEAFRDFFLKMKYTVDVSPNGSPMVTSVASSHTVTVTPSTSQSKQYQRQTTVECFQHLMSPKATPKQRLPGGLNGGSNKSSPLRQQLICDVESKQSVNVNVSLCAELHGLFRVLWSGKWAQVSPHAFLRSVWQAIPMFKGYAQHDAQEFLCELLDKVQQELDGVPESLRQADSQLLTDLFQGQLVSQVTCLVCGNVSQRQEPFMDLSLEFPRRYQITKQNPRASQDICHITEMLAKFTEEEQLEGQIYACEKCNKNRSKTVYTEAKKQLLIHKLPKVLRLHLKRFRWSGRLHREKISTHVAVEEQLDLRPYCCPECELNHEYHLFGLVIHHGKGFTSGHYTAYTWNKEADSWVNCNDSRMILSTIEDVLTAQSYILFYRAEQTHPPSLISYDSTDTVPYSLNSEPTLDVDEHSGPNSQENSSQNRSLRMSDRDVYSLVSNTSLKADGTEMVPGESEHDMFCDIDQFTHVDDEVSFNFSSVPTIDSDNAASEMKTKSETRQSGAKRSRDCYDLELSKRSSKSAKRLHFGTHMFYNKSKSGSPCVDRTDGGAGRTSVAGTSGDGAAQGHTHGAAQGHTHGAAQGHTHGAHSEVQDESLRDQSNAHHSAPALSPRHIKRRKSTLW